MPSYCCAPGCSNHQQTRQDLSIYRIPSEPDRRRRWSAAINRKDWKPSAYQRLCSDHFIGGKSNKMCLKMLFVSVTLCCRCRAAARQVNTPGRSAVLLAQLPRPGAV